LTAVEAMVPIVELATTGAAVARTDGVVEVEHTKTVTVDCATATEAKAAAIAMKLNCILRSGWVGMDLGRVIVQVEDWDEE